jgi:hypothetical protein
MHPQPARPAGTPYRCRAHRLIMKRQELPPLPKNTAEPIPAREGSPAHVRGAPFPAARAPE